jgi:hypothetical protein
MTRARDLADLGGNAATLEKQGLTLINTTSFSASSAVNFATDTFTSTYDNYKILYTFTSSQANTIALRVRDDGSNITSANYFKNGMFGGASSVTNVASAAAETSWDTLPVGTARTQIELTLFSPNLAEATQGNFQGYNSNLGNNYNTNIYFNLTTQVDSLSLYPSAGTITGRYSVYGFNK